MWLSLISIASSRPNRWLAPPPSRTASFSRTRRPGVVLRVQTILALVPAIASASARVAVATPDIRLNKLSAVRSAASTPRARPAMRATTSPRNTRVPSAHRRSIRNAGSISSKARSAASSPATTPGWRAAMAASTVASSGTTASVVMSPARPRSSSKAARTIGSMISRTGLPSTDRQHALDGAAGALGDGRIDGDLMGHRFEAVADLGQGDPLHVRAQIARPHKIEVGVLQRDIVAHRAFGQQDDARRPLPADIIGHRRGRSREIALGNDLGGAFRMRQDRDPGMALPEALDVLGSEALMHLAMPFPCDDLDLGLGCGVACQVFVGEHDDARRPEAFDDLLGVARCAADVGFGFDRRRGVDIGHDRHPGMALAHQPDVVR